VLLKNLVLKLKLQDLGVRLLKNKYQRPLCNFVLKPHPLSSKSAERGHVKTSE